MSSTLEPPWRRKHCKVNLSTSRVGTKEQNSTLLHALTKEQLDIYGRHLQVFTDASKTDNGKIAAAYILYTWIGH